MIDWEATWVINYPRIQDGMEIIALRKIGEYFFPQLVFLPQWPMLTKKKKRSTASFDEFFSHDPLSVELFWLHPSSPPFLHLTIFWSWIIVTSCEKPTGRVHICTIILMMLPGWFLKYWLQRHRIMPLKCWLQRYRIMPSSCWSG